MKSKYIARLMMTMGLTFLLANSYAAFAQATGDELLEKGISAVAIKSAREMADEMVAGKGWVVGPNKNTNGESFFVTIAAGDIQAPIDNPNYLDSRANAYDKAMMDAWRQIRQYVGEVIQADAKLYYEENAGEGLPDTPPTVIESKQKALLNGVLDEALRQVGVDPTSATPEAREKALTTETFSKNVASIAGGKVVGVQSYATFEGRGSGKGYQIVVVAVWSEKLQRLAEAMLTGGRAVSGIPGKVIKDWIPGDTGQLISTFGIQLVRDETGKPMLLAYAQSRPVTESSRSVDAAYDKAFEEAKGQLRFFAGAQAKVLNDFQKAESTEEFVDGTKSYTSDTTFRQAMNIEAPAQAFSGIVKVKTWKSEHPITKKSMVGVIAQWSPETALAAGKIGAQMDRRPGSSTMAPVVGTGRQPLSASEKGLTGAGTTGSDDF